ncbi:hypothetical protein [Ectothiorhodospira lacustris]|uniref:hypothetical protein n=1 Tax=Ectothiorhodospira lacustris TaxID=2899127 RepID=UPI001EE8225D|nr:hypothetical protein [Ectothiorhodospira lacustris]MCG5499329.1 hypothetical protein [Ectothiorhodospira lacustris]MCG5509218.1 hypothetical protein [Ectothiorhodospira lacustris]MCG5521008.1 hypothetical protein [Ectothiorhodospira lacustris]
MVDRAYLVAVTGKPMEGVDVATVKARLATLFRVPEARVEGMLAGKPVVVKKGVDEATARRYLELLREAGATARIMACAAEPAADALDDTPAAMIGLASTAIQAPELTLAPPGTDLSDRVPTPDLDVDLSGLTLAEPGATLGEPRDVPEPRIDTRHLSLIPGPKPKSEPESPDPF